MPPPYEIDVVGILSSTVPSAIISLVRNETPFYIYLLYASFVSLYRLCLTVDIFYHRLVNLTFSLSLYPLLYLSARPLYNFTSPYAPFSSFPVNAR